MFVDKKGNLYSWGDNNWGQLGLGDRKNRSTPTLVNYNNNVKISSIAVGGYHSLAVDYHGNTY